MKINKQSEMANIDYFKMIGIMAIQLVSILLFYGSIIFVLISLIMYFNSNEFYWPSVVIWLVCWIVSPILVNITKRWKRDIEFKVELADKMIEEFKKRNKNK